MLEIYESELLIPINGGVKVLNDFEGTRQKQNSRDMAHLAEGVCGICPICDPLHCLLVVMLN